MSNAVHINENYGVYVNEASDGYMVTNLTTKIVEFEAISLPECMFAAENLNVVIVHKTYEWVGKRARAQADEETGASPLSIVKPH